MRVASVIPNKLDFRIGEVADLLIVKPYVLRYWETEFPDIKPAKSKSGQRLYKRRDVELLVRIKELLYGERFTINGARKRLRELIREQRSQDHGAQMPLLAQEEETKPQQAQSPLAKTSQTSGPSSFDQRKTLTKIKKDLESVLVLLKG